MVVFRVEFHMRVLSHAGQVFTAYSGAVGSRALIRPEKKKNFCTFL